MVFVVAVGYSCRLKSECGEMNELVGAASLPMSVSERALTTVLTLSESLSIVSMSPPPSTGFSPPAVAGGKPNTPTLASRLLAMFFGKKPVMNEPWLYIQHFGPALSNIGLPAVPKLLLAIELCPPKVLPEVNRSLENSSAACFTSGESNLTVWSTHWLYTSAPCCFMISVSNQSVAGQPVAVSDSMPMHHGVPPSALIWSVRALRPAMSLGAL